jgi:hypothetical protein
VIDEDAIDDRPAPPEPQPTPDPIFPWPPAEGDAVARAFAATWTGASLRPRSFFAAMPDRASLGPALLYYVPLGIFIAGADLFWSTVRGGGPEQDVVLDRTDVLAGLDNPLVSFLLSPVILLLSLFVAAAVTHLLLRLFGGASRDFTFTARVYAFSYSPQAVGIVPVIGSVIGFIWMVGVAIIGLREGHRTTTARAAAAVLIPVAIALVFMAIAAFIALTGSLVAPQH